MSELVAFGPVIVKQPKVGGWIRGLPQSVRKASGFPSCVP